ncbi:wd40 repeat-containing protein : WD40 repeat-containing protein OS=Singulisphaera acidiphila (strain ATCC BAA-1392 / DSM 18658 / VKM B-2454 / MOB10) GN=Sinac_3618 PE=4 SV=1: Pkinase: WD40: WD40: WD40 [Gemmata massiliana]|uniref:Protein kinase domain-containing protein n=1 Tax=Gemmata massiliana TaxID=1210884 RepID=A0A6P2CPU6_9BACT|nr:serine/threonine-protein kinase [Gemmata massiliana]VTR90971.1 wd40 repeat-containing protein : WD40 repeat-containing protein OS=Singulisphaera acidiphila (strain ATCC BAA-1392 / DSM 18658 / VKM B-2454 / MOB10) GN=Sinac_3618 PE=4 SV=1: Pkinase: WD40: WD40: WD40 [Gemmata massiliana]
MSDCPDDTDLAGFLNDSLGADRLALVSGHVDGCSECQGRLDRLTEQASGAVARYKELSSGVLPDARSGGVASTPEDATLIVGGKPAAPVFVGLPRVPGFEVLREIGRGGMGIVYKARHRRLNRLVALKMILAGASADSRVVQRFLFEGEVLARAQHPQVVQVFEVDTYDGPNHVPVPYLAMELLEGGSLSRKLRATNDGAAPRLTPREAAELLEGIARAVHAAHLQGIIHRDLKPGNILFASADFGTPNPDLKPGSGDKKTVAASGASRTTLRTPNLALPKVTDFGLAKFTQESGADLTQTGQIVGTPHYMAPEQAAGDRRIGPAVDVYALGAILFECLAGRPPFIGTEPLSVMMKVVNEQPPDVRSFRPEVPRDLAAVTMKCLAKDPARRYVSAEALADDLRRFLDDRPTKARPVTNFERLWLSIKRNPSVAGLLALLAIVLCVAFVTFGSMWARAEEKARREESLKQLAEGATIRAKDAMTETQKREAQLVFRRAVNWCEEGRLDEGLELFVRAAELAVELGDENLERVVRINLAAWERDLPLPRHRFQHTEQPRLAAFHPDGKHLVTAGRSRELYLWDIASRKRVRTYKPTLQLSRTALGFAPKLLTYWTVAVSPDGLTIAAGGTDASLTLWETSLDRPAEEVSPVGTFDAFDADVRKIQGRDLSLWTMAFSTDRVLWTSDAANGLRRWDLTDPRNPVSKRFVPKSGANGATLQIMVASPDGQKLYTGDRAGWVREWDGTTGTELSRWPTKGWITDIALSPDGRRVAVTGPNGFVRVIDLVTSREVLELSLAGAYGNGVAFTQKQPFLAASDGDGNVRFWHRDTGQPIGIPLRFHGEVTRMRFRPGTDEFAVPAGNSVYLCTAPDPPCDLISAGRGVRIRGLDFSPTGDRLAVADDRTFDLFDPRTRKRVPTTLDPDNDALTVRFDASAERPRVFRGTRDGLDWFAVPNGKKVEPVPSLGLGRVHRLEPLRDGTALFVMGSTLVARYDAATLKASKSRPPAQTLPAGVELSAIAARPDGGEVFVAFGDSAAVLAGDTLTPLREWAIGDEVLDARYTPSGDKILLAMRANAAELRDARTGARVGPQMPHERAVAGVAISPNGAILVTASRDGNARFWDAATNLPLGTPLRHAGPVTHVAFAPDGGHIATGTGTGHVTLWDIPPKPRKGTLEELRETFGKKEHSEKAPAQ